MSRRTTRREALTAERSLDVAERLVQTRGRNSVSYSNIVQTRGLETFDSAAPCRIRPD